MCRTFSNSKVGAYVLVHSKEFPLIRHGWPIKVSKQAFFEWLEGVKPIASTNNAAVAQTGKCADTDDLLKL